MEDEFVTIKTFYYDHETLAFESRFEAAGIPIFMKDHKTVATDPAISNAIGGIKLRVRREDVERGQDLLKEIEEHEKNTRLGVERSINGGVFEKILDECPKCKEDSVFKEKYTFLQSLKNSFSKRKYYCISCKHDWTK